MWFEEGNGSRIKENAVFGVVMLLLVALVIVIGVYPSAAWSIAQKASGDLYNVAQYIKNVPLLPGVSP